MNPEDKQFYQLPDYKGEADPQAIRFFKLHEDGTHDNGTTIEAVINVSIERLTYLNSVFPSTENECALNDLQSALEWLNKRTADRVARGVEGKHVA